jgi:hypothetical protein
MVREQKMRGKIEKKGGGERNLIHVFFFLAGFLSLFPDAPVFHLGLYREKVKYMKRVFL